MEFQSDQPAAVTEAAVPRRAAPPSHPPVSLRRRRIITAGVLVGIILAAFEATVVSTAMPTVIASLGGLNIYSWVFSAYLLTSTITVPLWGKLSDVFGRRRFYLAGVAVFLLGSALSGQSRSMAELILFRAIQGIGAGAVIPMSLTIIADLYTLKERAQMQGLFGSVWGLSSIVGPLLGGIITDHLSWRWVFYVNVPVGIVAATIIAIAMTDRHEHERRVPIDYAGAAVMMLLITLFLGILAEGGKEYPWASAPIVGACVVCAGLLAGFLMIEHRTAEPILPFDLFANRMFRTSCITGFLMGIVMFGAISFIPLFVQGVIGTSATRAGSVLTPLMLGWVGCSIIGSRLLLRIGIRPTVIAGLLVLLVGFFLLARMDVATTQAAVARNMVIVGAGLGLSITPLLIAMQNAVPRRQLGVATSTNQFFRTIGGAVGVAIMGSVMSGGMRQRIADLDHRAGSRIPIEQLRALINHPDAIVSPVTRAMVPESVLRGMQEILAAALHRTFVVAFIVVILAFVSALFMPGETAQELEARREL